MLMNRSKVARHFGVSNQTIKNWSRSGKLPAPIKLPSGREAWDATQIPGAVPTPALPAVDQSALAASFADAASQSAAA